MIGAIAGDIIGSIHEYTGSKSKKFELLNPDCFFTDDSVLTLAVSAAILDRRPYMEAVRQIGSRYPDCGYGETFIQWLYSDDPRPYNSWGNGAVMRVSPVGWAFDKASQVLEEAARTAEFSHNHPEGVKGAQAAALAVYMARNSADKEDIRQAMQQRFGYNMDRTVDSIRPGYSYDISCQGTVPEAVIAFLDSDSYEDALRNAISLGGDADTLACIAGAVAEAYYGGVPPAVQAFALGKLAPELRNVAERFAARYCTGEEAPE